MQQVARGRREIVLHHLLNLGLLTQKTISLRAL